MFFLSQQVVEILVLLGFAVALLGAVMRFKPVQSCCWSVIALCLESIGCIVLLGMMIYGMIYFRQVYNLGLGTILMTYAIPIEMWSMVAYPVLVDDLRFIGKQVEYHRIVPPVLSVVVLVVGMLIG